MFWTVPVQLHTCAARAAHKPSPSCLGLWHCFQSCVSQAHQFPCVYCIILLPFLFKQVTQCCIPQLQGNTGSALPGCWRIHGPQFWCTLPWPLPHLVPALLSPVVQIDQRYVPQLQAVLSWPHSMGIVGGRPSSSLYFVGHLTDQLVFLDPHDSQQVR